MAITTLDQNTALIVIDLQNGIVVYPTAHPIAEVVKHACALVGAFRHLNLPVVLVNVAGGAPGRAEQVRSTGQSAGWADLIPELNQQPGDHTVTKRTWGAFTNTGLEAHLRGLGVTQLVICGVAIEGNRRAANVDGAQRLAVVPNLE